MESGLELDMDRVAADSCGTTAFCLEKAICICRCMVDNHDVGSRRAMDPQLERIRPFWRELSA
jgi:hypothetical protein